MQLSKHEKLYAISCDPKSGMSYLSILYSIHTYMFFYIYVCIIDFTDILKCHKDQIDQICYIEKNEAIMFYSPYQTNMLSSINIFNHVITTSNP